MCPWRKPSRSRYPLFCLRHSGRQISPLCTDRTRNRRRIYERGGRGVVYGRVGDQRPSLLGGVMTSYNMCCSFVCVGDQVRIGQTRCIGQGAIVVLGLLQFVLKERCSKDAKYGLPNAIFQCQEWWFVLQYATCGFIFYGNEQ